MENGSIEQMHQVWAVEQEILDEIHKVCVKHGLRYSLAYGTLIGAIRHEGFIPWDDDIDIMMPRQDYDKLKEIWQKEGPEGYIWQDALCEQDCNIDFAKIRKDHTAFLEYEEDKNKSFHKGIFVDIFPGDRVAPTAFSQKVQFAWAAVSMLYTRGYTSRTGGVIGLLEWVLMLVPKSLRLEIRDYANKRVRRWNGGDGMYVFPCTIRALKKHFTAKLFDSVVEKSFQGKMYLCTDEYESYLTKQYGDYMKLPPEKDQVWTHHPILIDFLHNYEELRYE